MPKEEMKKMEEGARIRYYDDDCVFHDEVLPWSKIKDMYPECWAPYFKITKIK